MLNSIKIRTLLFEIIVFIIIDVARVIRRCMYIRTPVENIVKAWIKFVRVHSSSERQQHFAFFHNCMQSCTSQVECLELLVVLHDTLQRASNYDFQMSPQQFR